MGLIDIDIKDVYTILLILIYNFILMLEVLITIETLICIYFHNIFIKINGIKLLNGVFLCEFLLYLILLCFFLDFKNSEKFSGSGLTPGSFFNTSFLFMYARAF